MLRLLFDRSQRILLSMLVPGLLLLALTLTVGAQSAPNITITSQIKEARPDSKVKLDLECILPGNWDPSTPGMITATWSANGSLIGASDGYIEGNEPVDVRWDYPKGLPCSNNQPWFTLQVGGSADPIVVTAALIVSDSRDLKQIPHPITGTLSIRVVDDSTVAALTESSLVIDPAGTVAAGTPFTVTVVVLNTGKALAKNVRVVLTPTIVLQNRTILSPNVVKEVDSAKEGTIAFDLLTPVETNQRRVFQVSAVVPPGAADKLGITGRITAEGNISKSLSSQVGITPPIARSTVRPPTVTPTLTAVTDVATPANNAPLADTRPLVDSPFNADITSPVLILALAFLTVLAAGAMLLFLLRSRRRPQASLPSVLGPSPAPPNPGSVTAPLPSSSASLEYVALPGMRIGLRPDVTTIGRASDSAIRIDERIMNWETVSRTHAEIRYESGSYVIYDVCSDRYSSNGIFVEGRRTVRNVLQPGWRIGIGAVEFIFRDTATEEQ